ncbi:MAG: DUF4422 domain-containing protein [Selenomonadaceae bacterium]|nr:DUF4422 domain-containing protein [Selenomonadaceae bacterium]
MKISIYIATQAEREFPKNENYIPLMVGKPNENLSKGLNDSTGDSISNKNPFYCELTGHYWIWQNDSQSDIVGLCHYRRFLWLNDIPRRLCRRTFKSIGDCEALLDTQSVKNILKRSNYDIILPKPYAFSGGDIKSQFIDAHGEDNYYLMIDAIKRNYPEYMRSVDGVFGRRFEYFANLMVSTKPIFDVYSEWLFRILMDVEQHIDLSDKKNLRMMGYIGERLLNLYVVHNKLKIKEVPQIFISENDSEKDLYIDLRYIKRRYFAGVLSLEESIRRKLSSK